MTQLVDDTSVRTSVEVNLAPDQAFHLFTAEIGAWDINVRWEIETDPSRCSEVEITFTALTDGLTRVQLTHRRLDRHGPGWETIRDAVAGG
jgi:hypothetical protein